ncbi:MAG: POTRA domain-containing protein [Polyangiales bacterium]
MRRLASLALALLALALPATARAQQGPPAPSADPIPGAEGLAGPVTAVVLDPPLPGEDPWARAGLARMAPFSAALAREALRRALASGTFASAEVSARAAQGGVELTIRGPRRYRLVSIEVRGASERDPEVVREDADLRADLRVTDAEVAEALRRVEGAYADAGFPDAHARPEWSDTDRPGARRLVLRVEEGAGRRVREVAVDGAPAGLEAGVREAMSLGVGDLAAPQRVRTSGDGVTAWLRRRGYLDARVTPAVEPLDGGGVRVRVAVDAGVRCDLVWFGVRALPDDALTEALRLGDEQGWTDSSAASFAARLEEVYARRGWADARVRVEADAPSEGRRAVRVYVREGRQVFVRALHFEGATVLTREELTELVESTARAELPSSPRPDRGYLLPERTFDPAVYAAASQRIVEAYRERGYLDAAVATPLAARVGPAGNQGMEVTFRVTEGPRSWLEELVFEGDLTQPSARLAGVWGLPLGVPVSNRELGEARVRLADWYREQGHAFARVEPEVERSPDHTRARVRVVVHEGPRVRVRRVEVRGARTVLPSVVRARLALAEGDVFSLSALRASQRQLYELGIFSAVNVGLEDGDVEAAEKTLLVRVVEERRVGLELRAGFSLGQGGRVGLEFAALDLFGLAMNLAVRPEGGYLFDIPVVAPTPPDGIYIDTWDVQRLTGRLPVSLGFPYVPGLGPRFGASLDAAVSRTLQPWSYELVTLGVGGTLTWRPVDRLSLSWTTEVQRINVGILGADSVSALLRRLLGSCGMGVMDDCNRFNSFQQGLRRYAAGVSDLVATRLGVVWDGRDNPLTPRSGLYASLTSELLYLLGFEGVERPSDATLHVEGRATGYVPLPVLNMVLTLSGRAGRNVSLTDDRSSHPSRLFWLGGASSMRAWRQSQLAPRETIEAARAAAPADRAILVATAPGGEFYINLVADLRVPLAFISPKVELGAFVDVGNVWQHPPAFADWWRLRVAPGVGLRGVLPVGIIALDVGFVVDPVEEAGESVFQTVQFYLGNTL